MGEQWLVREPIPRSESNPMGIGSRSACGIV